MGPEASSLIAYFAAVPGVAKIPPRWVGAGLVGARRRCQGARVRAPAWMWWWLASCPARAVKNKRLRGCLRPTQHSLGSLQRAFLDAAACLGAANECAARWMEAPGPFRLPHLRPASAFFCCISQHPLIGHMPASPPSHSIASLLSPSPCSRYNPANWMLEQTAPRNEEHLGVNFTELYANSMLAK